MFRKIIRGIIFIGFSVQILLGLAWMACNFSSVQDFAEVSTGIYGGAVRLLGKACPAASGCGCGGRASGFPAVPICRRQGSKQG